MADDLHAGRTPRATTDGLLVKDLCNRFLTAKHRKAEAGELSTAMFTDYKIIAELLVSEFGSDRMVENLAADDFATLRAATAKRWGPVRLGNSITRVTSVFKYAYDAGLIDRPVRFGPEFVKPDKATLRKHRATSPAKTFTAAELRTLIDGNGTSKPDTVMRAMILLGVNCGFGNTDCAKLSLSVLDLANGWIDFPRPKTGIARRCPLWPETVTALRIAIEERPEPARDEDANRVFLTGRRMAFVTYGDIDPSNPKNAGGGRKDVVGVRFRKLLTAVGLASRNGVGFYALRHVFETVGGGSKDQVAVDTIMGHADPSMGAVYREHVDDARLKAAAEHVRRWVFGEDTRGHQE